MYQSKAIQKINTFNDIENEFYILNPNSDDNIHKISNGFWIELSKKTGFTINQCYNLWINKNFEGNNTDIDYSIICKIAAQKPDWIELAQYYNKSPFELFKGYKRFQLLNRKSKWTENEDNLLKNAVVLHGEGKWSKISKYVVTKNAKQCLHRYKNTLQQGLRKGRWLVEEDNKLLEAVNLYTCKSWNKISEYVGTRNDPQCRERYVNILDPSIRRCKWTKEEDFLLYKTVLDLGEANWSNVSKRIFGRTDSQ
ncbi:hypothetical protein COBT_003724, partial [Conglomerata obtusa]